MAYNGVIVIKALKKLGYRAPLGQIIKQVSEAVDKPITQIREIVEDTIFGGIIHGYLQMEGNYIFYPRNTIKCKPQKRRANCKARQRQRLRKPAKPRGRGRANRGQQKTKCAVSRKARKVCKSHKKVKIQS